MSMDYIREELLRQQAALTALLLGKAAEEEPMGDGETAGGEWTVETAVRKSPAAAAAELETENARRPGAAGTEEAILLAGTLGRGGDAPAREMGGGLDMDRLAEPGGERMVTEVLWADTGGMSDAKALSRTFQRDARRYDGGFRLY